MRCHVFKKSLNPHNSMGRHLRVQLRCWSYSGDARCLRDLFLSDFMHLCLGTYWLWGLSCQSFWHLLCLFPSGNPPPSHPLPLLLHQVDTSFTTLLLLLLTLLLFLLCKNRLSQVDICPRKSEEENIIKATLTRCDNLEPWFGIARDNPKSWLFLYVRVCNCRIA